MHTQQQQKTTTPHTTHRLQYLIHHLPPQTAHKSVPHVTHVPLNNTPPLSHTKHITKHSWSVLLGHLHHTKHTTHIFYKALPTWFTIFPQTAHKSPSSYNSSPSTTLFSRNTLKRTLAAHTQQQPQPHTPLIYKKLLCIMSVHHTWFTIFPPKQPTNQFLINSHPLQQHSSTPSTPTH